MMYGNYVRMYLPKITKNLKKEVGTVTKEQVCNEMKEQQY